jgi:hypothetical protein
MRQRGQGLDSACGYAACFLSTMLNSVKKYYLGSDPNITKVIVQYLIDYCWIWLSRRSAEVGPSEDIGPPQVGRILRAGRLGEKERRPSGSRRIGSPNWSTPQEGRRRLIAMWGVEKFWSRPKTLKTSKTIKGMAKSRASLPEASVVSKIDSPTAWHDERFLMQTQRLSAERRAGLGTEVTKRYGQSRALSKKST